MGEALIWLRDNTNYLKELFFTSSLTTTSSSSSSTGSSSVSPPPTNNIPKSIPIIIRFDSEYAAKSVLGQFNGEKNKEMILYIRGVFKEVVYLNYDTNNLLLPSTATTTTTTTASTTTAITTKANIHQLYYLTFSKVKGHSGSKWNDEADKLATLGVSGETCNQGRYATTTAAAAGVSVIRNP